MTSVLSEYSNDHLHEKSVYAYTCIYMLMKVKDFIPQTCPLIDNKLLKLTQYNYYLMLNNINGLYLLKLILIAFIMKYYCT